MDSEYEEFAKMQPEAYLKYVKYSIFIGDEAGSFRHPEHVKL